MNTKATYKRVVIVGVDGAGNFFRFAKTPNMDRIFASGARTDRALTAEPTISAECWGAMLIGVAPEVHGLTNSIVSTTPRDTKSEYPSVFRVIRENDPDCELAAFCNWSPIYRGIIEDGLGVAVGTGGDEEVTVQVTDYLKEHDPKFLFVQFDEVDATGHSQGYGTEKYIAAIGRSDEQIGRIYDACASKWDDGGTLFIVDADHGGHGRSHGGSRDTEKYVTYAAVGRTVTHTEIKDMEIRDNAAIVLYALGYEQPHTWTGRVPSGLFEGVEAKERPVYDPFTVTNGRPEHKTRPTPEISALTSVIASDRILAYLPFDEDGADALGKLTVAPHGKLYYIDGYFGKGVRLDDGYFTLGGFRAGKRSFSVACWLKSNDIHGGPALISNKNQDSGKNPGVSVFDNFRKLGFNAGNGTDSRINAFLPYPPDFRGNWIYVAVAVDREAAEVRLSIDFAPFKSFPLPEGLKESSFDGVGDANIGQDGTGGYIGLAAELDEFLLIDGAMTDSDLSALEKYYAPEKRSNE